MFEKGKTYRITMVDGPDGSTSEYGGCKVLAVKLPLIKITGMTRGADWEKGITILNTTSSVFVSAQPVKVTRSKALNRYFDPPKSPKSSG